MLFARRLFPRACLERALDADEPAFAQIQIALLGRLAESHDAVPLGGLLRGAVSVAPELVCRDSEVGNSRAAAGHTVVRIRTQATDKYHPVYAPHDAPPRRSLLLIPLRSCYLTNQVRY